MTEPTSDVETEQATADRINEATALMERLATELLAHERSYHDDIQEHARRIASERQAVYQNGTIRQLSAREWQYLHGALYKMERVALFPATREKTLDDIVDSYNYLALLYNSLTIGPSQGGSA